MQIFNKYLHFKEYKIETKIIEYKKNNSLKPILLLHEGLGSVKMWKDWPLYLSEISKRDIVLYSRIGMGKSSPLIEPRKKDYMHIEAKIILPMVLKKLSLSDPIILGHSDGASIAMIYSGSEFPCSALILEAPHVFVEDVTIKSIKKAKKEWDYNILKNKLNKYHEDVDGAFNGWCNIWLSEHFKEWNIEKYISKIKVPVLIIQGKNDQYGTIEQIERIDAKLATNSEKFILENCFHTPHFEYSEEVCRKINEFLLFNA